VAKLLVQRGTLRVGDVIVCGAAHGRVKAMYDTLNGRVTHQEAGPSTPVNVTGLDIAPAAGDHFYVLDDIGTARMVGPRSSASDRWAASRST
jgi:translation initiation factor IF-2